MEINFGTKFGLYLINKFESEIDNKVIYRIMKERKNEMDIHILIQILSMMIIGYDYLDPKFIRYSLERINDEFNDIYSLPNHS